jgi:glutamate/aspartate transport system substrate-binding protein
MPNCKTKPKVTGLSFAAAALAALTLVGMSPVLAQKALPDTLGRIKAAHAINVAFSGDSLPFSSLDERNKPQGYSIDLCNRVIAQIGRAVNDPGLNVNWLVGSAVERITMVASGKADLDCANSSATLSRMKDVDFSNLIFVDGGGVMVKANSRLTRFADLNGKKIGVIRGTTTETRLRSMLTSRNINATVVLVREAPEGTALLESGGLDAFAGDKIKLVGMIAQATNPDTLAIMPDDLSFEPYAFAVPRNDSAFRLEVNKALSQVYQNGEIDTIFARWLGTLGRPSGLLAALFVLNRIPE